MEQSDLDALFAMYCDVIDDGGGAPVGGAPTREIFDEAWIRNRHVYVGSVGASPVGSYFIRPNFPGFAAHIAQAGYIVDRSARRRGIGVALIEDSLVRAKELGYTAMMFNLVFESNPSRRLYEAAGFEKIGRIPNARGEEAAIIYWRSLL
jgi:ribosomal protein S18 acetylase RimI-like enzyme